MSLFNACCEVLYSTIFLVYKVGNPNRGEMVDSKAAE